MLKKGIFAPQKGEEHLWSPKGQEGQKVLSFGIPQRTEVTPKRIKTKKKFDRDRGGKIAQINKTLF
jgi:hypothetical protein